MLLSGVENLGQQECCDLLFKTRFGRFVFLDRMSCAVHPVRYIFDGIKIMIPTCVDAEIRAARQLQLVTFEIDHIDLAGRTGWMVTASGSAAVVRDPEVREHAMNAPTSPWPSDRRTEVVSVHVAVLQGRRYPTHETSNAAPTASHPGPDTHA
jgi:uncharacterized protein